MKSATRTNVGKEAGDTFWEDEARNPTVLSASLIVPKEITRELFHPDGRISDKRLETIQYRCYCTFRVTKLPPSNPGSKVCERIKVDYSYPTRHHQVTLRMFTDLVQQCSSSLHMASLVKVSSVVRRRPSQQPQAQQQQQQHQVAKTKPRSVQVETSGHSSAESHKQQS